MSSKFVALKSEWHSVTCFCSLVFAIHLHIEKNSHSTPEVLLHDFKISGNLQL
jgi:hypothetical protein